MSSRFHHCLARVLGPAVAALWLAAAQPAAALPGLELVQQESVENRDEPHKRAVARCPDRKYVVGGGGKVLDGFRTRVGLTTLWPGRPPVGSPRGGTFVAVAEAVNGTRPYDWSLMAYAICAPREALALYHVARSTTPSSSQVFKPHSARCADHTHTYGSGAEVNTHTGKAFVQLYRTSGPLDIARATARAVPGFHEGWELTSYAICAVWRDQLFADGTIAPGPEASDRCWFGFTHGIGGGGGLTDGGPVYLKKVEPHPDLMGVDVALTGALDPSIGGMVAHQTCAW
jgi:hypothetical protein